MWILNNIKFYIRLGVVTTRTTNFGIYYFLYWDSYHEKAKNFRLFLESLGPIFIKFGQFLSTHCWLPCILNNELKKLQDNVSKPNIINHKLLPSGLIIDSIPIASASIATVHIGHIGEKKVAVKIRRPNINKEIKQTFRIIKFLSPVLLLFPLFRQMKFKDQIEIAEIFISEQNDFIMEANNLLWYNKNIREIAIIPKCLTKYCNENIITMEYEPGIKTDDLILSNQDKEILSKSLLGFFLSTANCHGKFHADLHNGNIAWRKENSNYRLIIYDFGLIGNLSKKQRSDINKFYNSLIKQDVSECKHTLINVFFDKINMSEKEFDNELEELIIEMIQAKDLNAINLILGLKRIMNKSNISLNPEMLKFQIALLNIDGIIGQLATKKSHTQLLNEIMFYDL